MMNRIATRPRKTEYKIHLRQPHGHQQAIIDSSAKRKIIRAGRRGGKTVVAAMVAVKSLLLGRRVLYAAPTAEQLDRFWFEVIRSLVEPIEAGVYNKNETKHIIERLGTENRIRAKTAWNADTLRGDYADLLILDEWQLMDEEAWELVGAPMLIDNNGDAIFIYTPPSLHSKSVSKARDPRHASKMFKRAQSDLTGRWQAFHFTSKDNPYISTEALEDIVQDMSRLAYRQEILAEDVEEAPGALWTRQLLNQTRVNVIPDMVRVVVGVDPPGGITECGVVVAGIDNKGQVYILGDLSLKASPNNWAGVVLGAVEQYKADMIVGETNYGGDMVNHTIQQAAKARNTTVRYRAVTATRGKAIRAEPVVAMYEQGRCHHMGELPSLEEELTMWVPGEGGASPNRMDAMVWAVTELMNVKEVNLRWL